MIAGMEQRTRAALLFFAGVGAIVAFGSVYAAYDLWGGVPRGLWRLMQGLVAAGVIGVGLGGVRWVRSWPEDQRLRATLRAALVLAVLAAAIGGALFTYYVERRGPSRAICLPAAFAPTLAERQERLAEGLGPLFPVIDPDSECLGLKRELDALMEHGQCPLFPPDDAPCRCGAALHEPGVPRCADGPTTCESREGARGDALGCPEGHAARRLDEYQESLRWQ